MKKLFLVVPMIISTMTIAAEIKGVRHANPVKVDSVFTETVGQGHPSTVLRIKATFSNSCVAPSANEVVVIPQYAHSFDDLILSVGNESNRRCPMVYRPVTVTINLGTYTKPNDGFFKSIIVNGVMAE